MKKLRMQKGVTLLELLMVVGIAAVISVSALVFFKSTDESNKISMEAKNVATLASGVANMFSGQGHYNGLVNATLISSNVLPDSMRGPGGTTIKHAWSASGVSVASSQLNSVSYDDVFTITYDDVPDRSCVDLMSKTYPSFLVAEVNGTAIATVADIAPLCTLGTANVLAWTR
jgi:prepilin-type N-terminal cleavage/methylation domain-containing protein